LLLFIRAILLFILLLFILPSDEMELLRLDYELSPSLIDEGFDDDEEDEVGDEDELNLKNND